MRLFFFNDTATTEIYTLSLHDALPILSQTIAGAGRGRRLARPTHRRRPQRRGWGRGLRRASGRPRGRGGDRESTRLNSSYSQISYAVFCFQKKKISRWFLISLANVLTG